MTITIHADVEQGSDEWYALRCGLMTSSEMKLVLTPTLKIADNDKVRAHVYELAAQRISKYVEPTYVSDDMLRGKDDEILATAAYEEKYAPVTPVGFVTNDRFGFVIGCSTDGLVGDRGVIENKSRRQKYQVETIAKMEMPIDYALQVQTTLLVTERDWCDFNSYSGGLPMVTIRIYPDPVVQAAIVQAATSFEGKVRQTIREYEEALASGARLIPTERTIIQEMFV